MRSASVPHWVRYALCAIVVTAFVVGQSVHSSTAEQAQQDANERLSVMATLVEAIPVSASGGKVYVSSGRIYHARWTTPDQVEHTGRVTAPSSAAEGATIEVWVDRETGAITDAPVTAQDAVTQASWAVLLTILAGAATTMLASRLAVVWSSRRQARGLESDWRRVAAEWRRRYL